MRNSNQLSVRSGVVEELTRTNHVSSSGGENTRTRTTHIILMKLAGQHAEMRSSRTVPLFEGESVKLVGRVEQGVFQVYAMQNLQTGWMTDLPKSGALTAVSGCTIAFTVLWVLALLVAVVISCFIFPLFALFPLAMMGLGIWGQATWLNKLKRQHELSRDAHSLLLRAAVPPPMPEMVSG